MIHEEFAMLSLYVLVIAMKEATMSSGPYDLMMSAGN